MKNTKFNKYMKDYYYKYMASNMYDLRDAYGTYSFAKHNAFEYCEQIRKEFDGENAKIITASKLVFTYGFTYIDTFDNTKHFVLITKSKELDAIIEE